MSSKQLSSRIDAGLERDLKVLAHTGLSNSDLVKAAMQLLAAVSHVAWTNGVVPVGRLPELTAYKFRMPIEKQPPAEGALNLPRLNLPKE